MSHYLTVSTAVTDEIILPDGSAQHPILGGAGIYALAGMKVWCDEVKIVSGIGADFHQVHGSWFAQNGLSTAGLRVVCQQTPRNKIQYFDDGERQETPVFGFTHYHLIKPTAADVARHCSHARGVYVFRNSDPDFWQPLLRLKERHGFSLMWEIAADSATPAALDTVRGILKKVDLFSINRQEAFHLFSTNDLQTAIAQLETLQLPLVYLRMGAEGAMMIAGKRVLHIPSIENIQVVDPTGGGNSSSGAVLIGFCEGKDALMAGIMGSISAAYSIAQYGPPPVLNRAQRQAAENLAAQQYARCLELQLTT